MQRGHRALIRVAAVWSTRDMGYRMRGHAHIGRQYRYAATGHLISSGGRLFIDNRVGIISTLLSMVY